VCASGMDEMRYIAPHGIGHVSRLENILTDEQSKIPDVVRLIGRDLLEHIRQITDRVEELSRRIDALSSQADTTRRLRTMPGNRRRRG
jgi:transposase